MTSQRTLNVPTIVVTLLALSIIAVVGGLFWVAAYRASELFVLRVRREAPDRVQFVRGRIPPQLLQDLREILSRSEAQGTLRALSQRGAVVVEARGKFSPSIEQRVRNTVGLYSLAKLRNGVPPRR